MEHSTTLRLRFCISVVIALFVLPFISAFPLQSGTTLNTSISNSSITFDAVNITLDRLTIEPRFIFLENVSYSRGELNISLFTPINWSSANSNLDSGGFPFIVFSSQTLKRFSSNLSHSVNASVTLNMSGTIPDSLRFVSHSGGFSKTFSPGEYSFNSTAQTLQLNLTNIEPGDSNTLTLDSLAPTITVHSPPDGLATTDPNIVFNITVTDTNGVGTINYTVLNRDFEGNFSGYGIYNAPAGSYTVIFCANDTAGNSACSDEIDFTVMNPLLPGGSITIGGGIPQQSFVSNGTAVVLSNFTVVTDETWTIGSKEFVYVHTLDSNGSAVDVDSIAISLNVDGNFTADNTVRIGKGRYQRAFTIESSNGTLANVSILVAQGSKEMAGVFEISLTEKSQLKAAAETAVNSSVNLFKRIAIIIGDNKVVFFGILGASIAVMLGIVLVRKKR